MTAPSNNVKKKGKVSGILSDSTRKRQSGKTGSSRHGQESLVLFKAEQVVEGRSGGLDSGLGAGAHISPSARSGPNAVTAADK